MPGRGLIVATLLAAGVARADEAPHWIGDLGIGLERTQALAPGAPDRTRALAYAYGDLGRLFVRVDTFGVKLLPVGWGALELVGRASTEGSDADSPGLAHRRNPRPVGLGTFQETPWGGVFADAFVDIVSGGTLLEASYAAEWPLGPLTLYPQVGLVRRSARYDVHLHDVHASATTPLLQLSGELPVAGAWVALAHVQWEPVADAVRASPRVRAHSHAAALLALAVRFK